MHYDKHGKAELKLNSYVVDILTLAYMRYR